MAMQLQLMMTIIIVSTIAHNNNYVTVFINAQLFLVTKTVSPIWFLRDIPDNWMEDIPEWVGVGTGIGLLGVEAGMGHLGVGAGTGAPVVEAGTGLLGVGAGMGPPVVEAGIHRRSAEVGTLHESYSGYDTSSLIFKTVIPAGCVGGGACDPIG